MRVYVSASQRRRKTASLRSGKPGRPPQYYFLLQNATYLHKLDIGPFFLFTVFGLLECVRKAPEMRDRSSSLGGTGFRNQHRTGVLASDACDL